MKIFPLIVVLLTATVPLFSHAQSYPIKPIRVVVPVPAGGTPDMVTRMVAPGVSSLLGQQWVIDNRGGAGGVVGAEMVARASPDGYTLMLSSAGPVVILPYLQKVPYDGMRDFAPVSLISAGPYVIITHTGAPFKSIKELIAYAKAQPGKLNYASAGSGAPNHMATELFKHMAGIMITHVPYKGAPQGVTEVMGGHIGLNFSSIPPVLQHIKSGRLLALAISSSRRSSQLPEVPTIAESGVTGYEFISWFGMFAPAKTPMPIIDQLNAALVRVVNTPEMRKQFETLGADPIGNSPEAFSAFIRRELEKNAKVVKLAGLKVD